MIDNCMTKISYICIEYQNESTRYIDLNRNQ
jgi:hypothetical protein